MRASLALARRVGIECELNTMRPDVTVIIPTRNRWTFLRRTLGSALRQESVSLEIIVVDDCSTDETPLRLARITDARVRLLRNADRRGVAAARNRAVAEATGEWIAFLDDDDLWAPNKLRAVLEAAQRRPGARWAYSGAVVVNEALDVMQFAPAPDPTTITKVLLTRNAVPGGCSNVIARAELVREVGGFDTRLAVLADWDMWVRLALTASAAASAEPLVAYVRHPTSMVSAGRQDVVSEVDHLIAKYREQAEAFGVRADTRGLYRYFARAHRRAGRRVPASRMYARIAVDHGSGSDAMRSVGALLGERAARLRNRRKRSKPGGENLRLLPNPAWLEAYRHPSGPNAVIAGAERALGEPGA